MNVVHWGLAFGLAIAFQVEDHGDRKATLIVMRGTINFWSHLERLEGSLQLSKRQVQQIETVRARVRDAVESASPDVRTNVELKLGLEAERKISNAVLRPKQREAIQNAILRDRCQGFGWFGVIHSGDISRRLAELHCDDKQIGELSDVEQELRYVVRERMSSALEEVQRRGLKAREALVRDSLEELTKQQRSQLTAIENGSELATSDSPKDTPVLWHHAFRVMSARPDLRGRIKTIREFDSRVRKDFNEADKTESGAEGAAKSDYRGFDEELEREVNRQFLELLDAEDVIELQMELVRRAIAFHGACALLDKRLLREVPQLGEISLSSDQREALKELKADTVAQGYKFTAEQNKIREQALQDVNEKILGVFDKRQQTILRDVLGAKTLDSVPLVVDLL